MALTTVSLGFAAGTKLFSDTDNENVAVVVQASATTVSMYSIDNTANAAQDNYVKFYNSAGAVTVGTTVPDKVEFIRQGVSRTFVVPDGQLFALGLQVAVVTAGGTGGVTSPTASVVVKIVYT